MTYSQKYTLMHFIDPIPDGTTFHMSDWPLHITIADVFAVDRHGIDIDSKIKTLVSAMTPIDVTAIGDSILGTTPVVLLEKSAALQRLHNDIVALLEKSGAVFNNPEFTRAGFLPHSTIQATGRLQIGEVVRIDSVSLVDMFPGNDWQRRRVLATFHFSFGMIKP